MSILILVYGVFPKALIQKRAQFGPLVSHPVSKWPGDKTERLKFKVMMHIYLDLMGVFVFVINIYIIGRFNLVILGKTLF